MHSFLNCIILVALASQYPEWAVISRGPSMDGMVGVATFYSCSLQLSNVRSAV